MKLIFVGNGVDLHVGLKTSYKSYQDYLKSHCYVSGENAIELINDSPYFIGKRKNERWSDLEETLTFGWNRYIEDKLRTYDRDVNPNNFQESELQLKDSVKFEKVNPEMVAWEFSGEWFLEWISKEYYQNIEKVKSQYNGELKDIFTEDSIIVNFNYTHTLEDLFSIKKDKILYIHNRLPDKKNVSKKTISFDEWLSDLLEAGQKTFQFGSPKNDYEECQEILDNLSIESKTMQGKEGWIERDIKQMFLAFSKNLNENYDGLAKFIDSYIDDIDEVIIIGHSMLGVDEPYYRDIVCPKLKSSKWTIYWHDENDEISTNEFVEKYLLENKDVDKIQW